MERIVSELGPHRLKTGDRRLEPDAALGIFKSGLLAGHGSSDRTPGNPIGCFVKAHKIGLDAVRPRQEVF